jgi:hypothetical protein
MPDYAHPCRVILALRIDGSLLLLNTKRCEGFFGSTVARQVLPGASMSFKL